MIYKIFKNIIFIGLGLFCFSFLGIKKDLLLHESFLFLKHKPNLKFEYYSPIHSKKVLYEDLSPELQKEEDAYQNFAKTNEQTPKDYFAVLLLQVGIFLVFYGLLNFLARKLYNKAKWKYILRLNLLGIFILSGIYPIFWLETISAQTVLLLQSIINILLIYYMIIRKKNKKA